MNKTTYTATTGRRPILVEDENNSVQHSRPVIIEKPATKTATVNDSNSSNIGS